MAFLCEIFIFPMPFGSHSLTKQFITKNAIKSAISEGMQIKVLFDFQVKLDFLPQCTMLRHSLFLCSCIQIVSSTWIAGLKSYVFNSKMF